MKAKFNLRTTLIVSTADNPRALDLVFEALSYQTRAPGEVLIADDGSDAQTGGVIEKWRKLLPYRVERFWFPHETFRRSVALNHVVRAATGDYLIFLDGDCVPHRRFIGDHIRHAAPHTFVQGRRAGIRARHVKHLTSPRVHPLRLFLQGSLYDLKRGIRRPWARTRYDGQCLIQGSNFAVWREDYFRVNGHDERLASHSYADTELAARLTNAGVRCKKVIGQLIVFHLDHARVAHYLTGSSEHILERTRAEKRVRCEQGIVAASASAPPETRPGAGLEPLVRASQFRDESVPALMRSASEADTP